MTPSMMDEAETLPVSSTENGDDSSSSRSSTGEDVAWNDAEEEELNEEEMNEEEDALDILLAKVHTHTYVYMLYHYSFDELVNDPHIYVYVVEH
jgi:hypothetical protein